MTMLALAAVGALGLGACSDAAGESPTGGGEEIVIDTRHGPVAVERNAQRVAVLDNTAMETVRELGVEPVALPKPLLPREMFADWIADDEIRDAGTHREPDLDMVSAADPDLIIGGSRFDEHTSDLEAIATVIDIAPSDDSPEGYVQGLRDQTLALGEIFDAEQKAEELVAELDDAITRAAEATSGQSVFLAVATGNIIDNGAGRIGRIIEPLNLNDVFASEDLDADSVHQDSGLAPETIAQANPDWVIVLDRDAATTAAAEATPARELMAAQEAFRGTTFMAQDQVIYLDPYFYTREGIQAYTEAYVQIAEAFGS
ncbi:MAG TPA: ABC transporter substrate-binding protein [Actinomycetaceae bacterium]|nr:ABC transporter substrate-binding protein [Actinomycetaceae bacterium]